MTTRVLDIKILVKRYKVPEYDFNMYIKVRKRLGSSIIQNFLQLHRKDFPLVPSEQIDFC